jgi:hypothetical protein
MRVLIFDATGIAGQGDVEDLRAEVRQAGAGSEGYPAFT